MKMKGTSGTPAHLVKIMRKHEKLMIMKSIQDHGAKHSPPGDRGKPEWPDGVPPVWCPVTPSI